MGAENQKLQDHRFGDTSYAQSMDQSKSQNTEAVATNSRGALPTHRTNWIKLATVLVFVMLLIAPTLQSYLGLVTLTPVQENRNKTPRPARWLDLFKPQSEFALDYERYYNDVFGFRDLLIRLKNQVDYTLFNKSREIIIGADNWLYYKSVVEGQQVAAEQYPDSAYVKLFNRIERMADHLSRRGIALIVVPNPVKSTIYPEYLPTNTARLPAKTGFQRYREFLQSSSKIHLIDSQAILEELKKQRPVFHQTDFHWNDPAGFVVAQHLVDKLGKLSGTGITWSHQLKIRTESLSGGQNNSLAIFWPFHENALMLEENLGGDIGTIVSSGRPNEWRYLANDKSPPILLPQTVLFGDSFADAFLRSGFTVYFSELQKYWINDLAIYFKDIPPGTRFVVFEHIEAYLSSLLSDEAWPPELR